MICGGVTVRVLTRDGRPATEVDPCAALSSTRLFAGKSRAEAARLAGLLFNLCGAAQEGAARAAFGLPQTEGVARRIALETLRHHAREMAVGWPEAAGTDPDRAALAALGARPDMDALGRALFGPAGCPEDARAYADWRARGETAPARALAALWAVWRERPAAGPALWRAPEALAAGRIDFAAAEIDGAPVETGLAARMGEHPLMQALADAVGRGALWRMTARLLDADRLIGRWRAGGGEEAPRALAPGVGIAQAARGLLIARGEADGDVATAFRNLTPTDCALHPRGALRAALYGIGSVALPPARAAAVALASVDPCMEARVVEVADA